MTMMTKMIIIMIADDILYIKNGFNLGSLLLLLILYEIYTGLQAHHLQRLDLI